jgi:predicted alpha/beta superfamily hydrolase
LSFLQQRFTPLDKSNPTDPTEAARNKAFNALQKIQVTAQQHLTNTLTPIFIVSPKLSTHNDGLNRGSKHNKSCTYDDRVLPNYGTGETRAQKKSHAERT